MPQKLLIELDGGQHAEQHTYDKKRDEFLREKGYKILRFWNNDVFENCFGVLESIRAAVQPPPPQQSAPNGLTTATPPQGGSDWSVERARAYLDRMPQHLADHFPDRLVDSELGPIPEGWAVKALGELCHKPQYGYTTSAMDDAVGPKFLRITDINKNAWIDWGAVPYCKITDDDLEKYLLNKGDILIARMADPGHGVLIEEDQEAVFASYLIRFRPLHMRNARLLQYWFRSSMYWALVLGRGAGTTRVSLNAIVLSEFPLVVPTTSVAEAFEEHITSLRARVVANASESCTLAAQRDALLPKLISGEIRIRDAETFLEQVR